MYFTKTNTIPQEQSNYFLVKMIQTSSSLTPDEFIVLAVMNNIQGYGYIVQYSRVMDQFIIRFVSPSARDESGRIVDWKLTTDTFTMKNFVIEELLGEVEFKMKDRLPFESNNLKIGSTTPEYIPITRDKIFRESVRSIHETLDKIHNYAQTEGSRVTLNKLYKELPEPMVDDVMNIFIKGNLFVYPTLTDDIKFILSYGESKRAETKFEELLKEHIASESLGFDCHFIEKPGWIENLSVINILNKNSKYFGSEFGIVQIIESPDGNIGTYFFKVNHSQNEIVFTKSELIHYIHSDGNSFLIYNHSVNSPEKTAFYVSLLENNISEVRMNINYSFHDQDELLSNHSLYVDNKDSIILYDTVLSEETLIKKYYDKELLYLLDDTYRSLYLSTSKDYDSLKHLYPIYDVELITSKNEKLSLRGFAFIKEIIRLVESFTNIKIET